MPSPGVGFPRGSLLPGGVGKRRRHTKAASSRRLGRRVGEPANLFIRDTGEDGFRPGRAKGELKFVRRNEARRGPVGTLEALESPDPYSEGKPPPDALRSPTQG